MNRSTLAAAPGHHRRDQRDPSLAVCSQWMQILQSYAADSCNLFCSPMAVLRLSVLRGFSSRRPILLGVAPAALLHRLSFADVLDETTGTGYQRRFSVPHSLDFRRYIQRPGSTTIPLTLNLRPTPTGAWRVVGSRAAHAQLIIKDGRVPVFSQVDCQHRLGRIGDLDLELPFMTFLGLTPREELEIFSIINGKAKGLSSSLLDFHDARLASDLGRERPELFIALHLHESEDSPWYQQLDLGGEKTVGLQRRASLRTMQQAVRRFLNATDALSGAPAHDIARTVRDYWTAVAEVLDSAWREPRRHVLNKGIGVYALMGLLGDLWTAHPPPRNRIERVHFEAALYDLAGYDWSTSGPLAGLGGLGGAHRALEMLRAARAATKSPGLHTLETEFVHG
jgi:DNA sulfur modification protein DndB